MRYTILIDGAAGAFGVVFPDLPGCTAMGATLDDAIAIGGEALRDWVQGVEARGGLIPTPRTPDALRVDPEVARALAEGASMATVILVRDTGRPVRANLSLDAGVLAAIDVTAKRLGITRSATVELLAQRALSALV